MYVCCTGGVVAVLVDLNSHIVVVISLSLLGVVVAISQPVVVVVPVERWTPLPRRRLACPQVVVVEVLVVVLVVVVVVVVAPQVVLP